MSPKELLAAYPKVRAAVCWTEAFVCIAPEDDGTPAWEVIMNADPPLTPDEIVALIRDTIREEVEGDNTTTAGRRAAMFALPQVDHPDYLTYIRGKVGCM